MDSNFIDQLFGTSSEQIRDEMLNYMEQKYGKKFHALSLERRGIDRNSDKLNCYAEGDESLDYAYVYRDYSDNDISYQDTYFGVLIRDDAQTEVELICKSLGLEAKAFVESSTSIYSNEYNSEKTFNDLKLDETQPGFLAEIALISDSETINNDETQNIFNALSRAGFRGMFTLYYFKRDAFESITTSNKSTFLTPRNDQVVDYCYQLLGQ